MTQQRLAILQAALFASISDELCERIAAEPIEFRCRQLLRGVVRRALEHLDDWNDDAKRERAAGAKGW